MFSSYSFKSLSSDLVKRNALLLVWASSRQGIAVPLTEPLEKFTLYQCVDISNMDIFRCKRTDSRELFSSSSTWAQ